MQWPQGEAGLEIVTGFGGDELAAGRPSTLNSSVYAACAPRCSRRHRRATLIALAFDLILDLHELVLRKVFRARLDIHDRKDAVAEELNGTCDRPKPRVCV
eukprot:2259783-Pleurochrysis_carterae.AAC.1